MSTRKPSPLYLIADEVGLREYLAASALKPVSLAEGNDHWELFLKSVPIDQPAWIGFLANHLAPGVKLPPLDGHIVMFLLLIRKGNQLFASTGGSAHTLIAPFVDKSFGIALLSRLATVEQLRSYAQRLFAGPTAQREEHIRHSNSMKSLLSFDGRIFDSLRSEISKETLHDKLGITIQRKTASIMGRTSLLLRSGITLGQLDGIAERIVTVLALPEKIPVSSGFTRLSRDTLTEGLRNAFDAMLEQQYQAFLHDQNAFVENEIGLSHQDFNKFSEYDLYLKVGRKSPSKLDTNDLFGLLAAAKSLGIPNITEVIGKAQIIGFSPDDGYQPKKPPHFADKLLAFFAASIAKDGKEYILIDGEYLLAGATVRKRVDDDTKAMVDAGLALASQLKTVKWPIKDNALATEDDFGKAVNETDWAKARCVYAHRKPVTVAKQNRGEIADIAEVLDAKLLLHHIKPGLGVQLRAVCAQVTEALIQLTGDDDYAGAATDKLRTLAKPEFVGVRHLNTMAELRNGHQFVVTCVDHLNRAGQPLMERLTFLAKLQLSQLSRTLRTYSPGRGIAVIEISRV